MKDAYWYAAPLCGAALSLAVLSVPVFAESQPRAESTPCVGDCGGDGSVTVDELLTMVNIALEELPVENCSAADANHDGSVGVDEIVAGVDNLLVGCR